MDTIGLALYLILLALALMFWRHRRRRSLDDLLESNEHAHHHVHRVIAGHPLGGTWKQHKTWMEEAKD